MARSISSHARSSHDVYRRNFRFRFSDRMSIESLSVIHRMQNRVAGEGQNDALRSYREEQLAEQRTAVDDACHIRVA